MSKPSITIAIPTYNASEYLDGCLKSIFFQDYPQSKLEVIIVDNYSKDKTLEIARRYKTKILMNKVLDAQASKMLALKKARGDFFMYLDADMRLRGKSWFDKMLQPLLDDYSIVGSFTRYYQQKDYSWLTRFLTYDSLQRDPVYEFFSPSIEDVIKENRKRYSVCEFSWGKIPPQGLCLYRTSILRNSLIYRRKKFMELDNLAILVSEGHKYFAYVEDAGLYHNFVKDLSVLLKKRLRNIKKNYLFQEDKRYYRWFKLENPRDFIKVLAWLLYVHLFFPSLIRGVYRSVKHKDYICLVEPVLNFVETYFILAGFVLTIISEYTNRLKQRLLWE